MTTMVMVVQGPHDRRGYESGRVQYLPLPPVHGCALPPPTLAQLFDRWISDATTQETFDEYVLRSP